MCRESPENLSRNIAFSKHAVTVRCVCVVCVRCVCGVCVVCVGVCVTNHTADYQGHPHRSFPYLCLPPLPSPPHCSATPSVVPPPIATPTYTLDHTHQPHPLTRSLLIASAALKAISTPGVTLGGFSTDTRKIAYHMTVT